MKSWWFGCDAKPASAGHGLHPYPYKDCPFTDGELDGKFAPRLPGRSVYEPRGAELAQGQARLTHRKGSTVLAFWDRTGDARGASNTAFIFDEIVDGETALREARERWPKIWARFTFPVEVVEIVES